MKASTKFLAGAWSVSTIVCAGACDFGLTAAPEVHSGAAAPDSPPPPFTFVGCDDPGDPLPDLVEDRSIYDQDSLEVLTVRVTITDLEGLAAVNDDVDPHVPRDTVRALFQANGFTGRASGTNAGFKARGHASLGNEQKNYKIKLDKQAGLWRGQREINLNKHMHDLTRVRNKAAFDLFETVEHFTSARTQFVRLYINGEDQGLYTMIEELDHRFLRNHGLDPDGQLYKGAHYHFEEIDPAVIANPASYDESLDYLLENKANPDFAKLMRMVEAVNDESLDSEAVIETYFNRSNLATWLAVNVLLNNVDTVTQNYYIYSPSSCEGWYLLPWDYDGAFNIYGQDGDDTRQRFRSGLANWWSSRLFKRFFEVEDNVQAVHDRIVELQGGAMSDDKVAALLASYDPIVSEHISRMPDIEYLPNTSTDDPETAIEVRHAEIERISTTVSRFYAEYLYGIERPMPVHQSFRSEDPLRFRWDRSFDLQGDPLTYDLQVSTTPAFRREDLVVEQRGLTDRETTVDGLPGGEYFWRVVIRDHKGPDTWQLPFEELEDIAIP